MKLGSQSKSIPIRQMIEEASAIDFSVCLSQSIVFNSWQ